MLEYKKTRKKKRKHELEVIYVGRSMVRLLGAEYEFNKSKSKPRAEREELEETRIRIGRHRISETE